MFPVHTIEADGAAGCRGGPVKEGHLPASSRDNLVQEGMEMHIDSWRWKL
jgi:hypothetical protein